MLLTRAPLTLTRTSSRRGSFDLHVLGTPPAFVLSQDQTLMKVSWVVSDSYYLLACIFIELPLCLEFIFGYVVIIQMNYPLHIFGVCLCSVFNELRCCLLKQLLYNITFDWNCQQVFSTFFISFSIFRLVRLELPYSIMLSNTRQHFFYFIFTFIIIFWYLIILLFKNYYDYNITIFLSL